MLWVPAFAGMTKIRDAARDFQTLVIVIPDLIRDPFNQR
jgi:hypothetical protein